MSDPVFKRKYLSRALGAAAAALMLSAAPLYAQSTYSSGAKPTEPSSTPSPSSSTPAPSTTTDASSSGTAGTSTSGDTGSSGAAGGSTSVGTPAGTAASGTSSDTTSGAAAGGSTGATGSTSAAAGASSAKLSSNDRQMLQQLAQSNLAEIATAKMAQEKSSNEDVKKFAQQMIDDHTKAMEQLQQVAQQKGVDLPTEPDAKHQAMVKKMETLSGDAFDRQYMAQAGTAAHKQAHQLVSRTSKRAKDPELKSLASQMEPTIAQHMKMAKDTRQDVASAGKGEQSTGSSGAAGSSASSGGKTENKGSDTSGGSGKAPQ